MGVIFDLDQTIVDSAIVYEARRRGDWSEVNRLIPQIKPYPKIVKLIQQLTEKGIEVAVVTSSPSFYCQKVLDQCGLLGLITVCYHDTDRHKPNPDPLQEAVRKMKNQERKMICAIGDTEEDVIAAQSAGYFAVLTGWANSYRVRQISTKPDIYCKDEDALLRFFMHTSSLKTGISFFKEKEENIFTMFDYYPSYKPSDQWSRALFDAVKMDDDRKSFFRKFCMRLPELMLSQKKYGIFVVPSSGQERWNEPLIEKVALPLAKAEEMYDCSRHLRRFKPHKKVAYGGDRSVQSHLDTIDLQYILPEQMEGALIIDDITTTGNIFRACIQKIVEAGIPENMIVCAAIGGTEYIY